MLVVAVHKNASAVQLWKGKTLHSGSATLRLNLSALRSEPSGYATLKRRGATNLRLALSDTSSESSPDDLMQALSTDRLGSSKYRDFAR